MPHRDTGHGNENARSDAGESDALRSRQGTNSPRGTRKGADFSSERVCPPDGTHSGLVSSLVSRWEVDTRPQSSGQGMEPPMGAMLASSELSRSQGTGAGNLEDPSTPDSSMMYGSDDENANKAPPNPRRRRAYELRDGYSSLATALTQLAGRVHPESAQARKIHRMANPLLEDYQRDGEVVRGIDVDMSSLQRVASRLPGL